MKTYRINSLKNKGSWWTNFSKYHSLMTQDPLGFSKEEILRFLERWNARHIRHVVKDTPRGHTLEFKSEKDMMLFLLRWS